MKVIKLIISKSIKLFLILTVLGLVVQSCSQMISPKFGYALSRRFLLRDEGLSQLSYIDLAKPASNWFVPIPAGRDLQLVGNGKVLIGTGNGYEEREILNGSKVFELNNFPGTQTARRLRNGNTLLAGANWQQKDGIVLVEVNDAGAVQRTINYPGFSYVRCIRETAKETFLVTADDLVFEGDVNGTILWQAKVAGPPVKPHVWQALRLGNGHTIASGGYAKNLQIFDAEGKIISTITGPAEVNPNFYAGFQILKNGNYVVANWQGHGPTFGNSGIQVLEYNPNGKLVWSWKQDATKFSSLQGIIVLDGLNLDKLNVENSKGVLTAID